MDGSQKIPQRWLATAAQLRSAGRDCPAILAGIAAWLAHLRGDNEVRVGPVEDPLAAQLCDAARGADKAEAIMRIVEPGGLLGSAWQPSDDDIRRIVAAAT